jgi:hypothetical protein
MWTTRVPGRFGVCDALCQAPELGQVDLLPQRHLEELRWALNAQICARHLRTVHGHFTARHVAEMLKFFGNCCRTDGLPHAYKNCPVPVELLSGHVTRTAVVNPDGSVTVEYWVDAAQPVMEVATPPTSGSCSCYPSSIRSGRSIPSWPGPALVFTWYVDNSCIPPWVCSRFLACEVKNPRPEAMVNQTAGVLYR